MNNSTKLSNLSGLANSVVKKNDDTLLDALESVLNESITPIPPNREPLSLPVLHDEIESKSKANIVNAHTDMVNELLARPENKYHLAFTKFCVELQHKLRKIYPECSLSAAPQLNAKGIVEQSKVQLYYNDIVLFETDTNQHYLKYDSHNYYMIESEMRKFIFTRNWVLEHTASFSLNQFEYQEITERKMQHVLTQHMKSLQPTTKEKFESRYKM